MISAGYNGHICLIVFMYIHRKIFINTKNKQTNKHKKSIKRERKRVREGWGGGGELGVLVAVLLC